VRQLAAGESIVARYRSLERQHRSRCLLKDVTPKASKLVVPRNAKQPPSALPSWQRTSKGLASLLHEGSSEFKWSNVDVTGGNCYGVYEVYLAYTSEAFFPLPDRDAEVRNLNVALIDAGHTGVCKNGIFRTDLAEVCAVPLSCSRDALSERRGTWQLGSVWSSSGIRMTLFKPQLIMGLA